MDTLKSVKSIVAIYSVLFGAQRRRFKMKKTDFVPRRVKNAIIALTPGEFHTHVSIGSRTKSIIDIFILFRVTNVSSKMFTTNL